MTFSLNELNTKWHSWRNDLMTLISSLDDTYIFTWWHLYLHLMTLISSLRLSCFTADNVRGYESQVRVHVCTHASTYVYYLCWDHNRCACMYVRICVHMYIAWKLCIYDHTCACMYVSICVHMYIAWKLCIYDHRYVYMNVHMQVHIVYVLCMCMYTLYTYFVHMHVYVLFANSCTHSICALLSQGQKCCSGMNR